MPKKNKHNICVVSSSRADYAYLYWVMKNISRREELQLQLIVTGTHLSPEFGLTYREIENDGFPIDKKIEIILSSDSPIGVAKTLGLTIISFSEAFSELHPDMIVVDGDRFETLGIVQSATLAGIPVAHISGGDVTHGSLDDSIRHCITKLSSLHFPSNEEAKKRILQLGEKSGCVFNYGSPGIDYITRMKLLSRDDFEKSEKLPLRKKNILFTFHAPTIHADSVEQCKTCLTALDQVPEEIGIIITKTNADKTGRAINKLLEKFSTRKENVTIVTSLGIQKYISILKIVDAVVGNSSSGLYEAPSLGTPTVNIGDRQAGRPLAPSVLNCEIDATAIRQTILRAMKMRTYDTVSPYGDGFASEKIVQTLVELLPNKKLLQKEFQDMTIEMDCSKK